MSLKMAILSSDLEALAASRALIAYVGYGSLVNLQTHRTPSIGALPIKLNGWRRQWCLRNSEGGARPALLSGVACSKSQIDAVLVYDHISSLPSLDAREGLYDRLELARADIECAEPIHDCPLYIYRAQDLRPAQPSCNFLLQSYLDAVFQGHEDQFGAGAIARFIETTDHWGLPLNRDRDAPLYPRPVEISHAQSHDFDQTLEPLIASRGSFE